MYVITMRKQIVASLAILTSMTTAGMLTACEDQSRGYEKLEAIADAEKTLGITPLQFIDDYNEELYDVFDEMAQSAGANVDPEAMAKAYAIDEHNESIGLTEGMFEALSGPHKLSLFGKVHKKKNELISVGVVLNNRDPEYRREHLAIAITIGVLFTKNKSQEMEKIVNRLVNTVIQNPDQTAVAGAGNVILSAFVTNSGIIFQAARKP